MDPGNLNFTKLSEWFFHIHKVGNPSCSYVNLWPFVSWGISGQICFSESKVLSNGWVGEGKDSKQKISQEPAVLSSHVRVWTDSGMRGVSVTA